VATEDETRRFRRRRVWLRHQGVALGSSLVLIPLLVIRRGDAGWDWLWFVLAGVLLLAASIERGPDEIALERHAIVVRGGRRRRREWVTRFERGEVAAARVDGWWLGIERTDGERLRYWLRSHDRAAIAAALVDWRPGRTR
jgi:hypothetical protein